MRTLHFLVKFAVSAGMIAATVFVFLYPVSDLWAILTANIPDNELFRQILAVAAGIAVLLVFLPLWPKRGPKERTFSFQGTHGEVTVDLEPVEDILERVLSKLPEVKWVTVRIEPKVEATPSEVQVFVKGSFRREDGSDVRHTSAWIQGFVKSRVQKMLGVEAVDVSLRLKNQPTNMKSVKPEPLMLEAPSSVPAAATAYAQAPSAPVAAAPAPVAPVVPEPEATEATEASASAEDEPVVSEAPSSIPAELLDTGVDDVEDEEDDESAGIRFESPAFEALEREAAAEPAEAEEAEEEQVASGGNDRDASHERRQPESW